MNGSESPSVLKALLLDALRENELSLLRSREELVKLLTSRNMMESELKRKDARIIDLQSKFEFAEKIKNAGLADEIKSEIAKLQQERNSLANSLIEIQVKSEAAKLNQPEDEALYRLRAQELRLQFTERAADILERGLTTGSTTDPDNLWERAAAKASSLSAQAAAIQEVLLHENRNAGIEDSIPKPSQKTVDELLIELETRLLSASTISTTENKSVFNLPSEEILQVPKSTFAVHFKGEKNLMALSKRVRVAGIGTGGIFRGAHLPPYVNIPQAQLVALCDPDKEAQDLAYKKFQCLVEEKVAKAREENDLDTVERLESDLENIVICEDISQVIEKVKPDLVDICTQPFLHTPLSIQALEAGINVMCEKPLSRSWLESERLIPAIKRSGKTQAPQEVQICFQIPDR